jgi:hypothetical protein
MTRKTIAEYHAELEDLCQQVEDRVPRVPSFETILVEVTRVCIRV